MEEQHAAPVAVMIVEDCMWGSYGSTTVREMRLFRVNAAGPGGGEGGRTEKIAIIGFQTIGFVKIGLLAFASLK